MRRWEIRIIGWEEMSLYYVGKEEIRKSGMQEMRKLGGRNKECMKRIEERKEKRKTLEGRNKKKIWREIGRMNIKKGEKTREGRLER